jgi:hypothetical protein
MVHSRERAARQPGVKLQLQRFVPFELLVRLMWRGGGKVDGDQHSPHCFADVLRPQRAWVAAWRHEHRNGGLPQYPLRRRSEEQLAEPGCAVRSHDDQIAAEVSCMPEDLGCGLPSCDLELQVGRQSRLFDVSRTNFLTSRTVSSARWDPPAVSSDASSISGSFTARSVNRAPIPDAITAA